MDIRDVFHELLLIIFLLCTDPGLSIFEDDEYYEPSFNRCLGIQNKLKNGRVRYIDKGRIAKFLCDRRFELVGKTSSTCLRGQWSNPVPVCVARGCNRVRSVSNGRVTAMYRGAVLVFVCNPGYTLVGSPTIHCEGRRWNTTPPSCVRNSTGLQNADETTQKGYTTSSVVTSQSTFYTTLQNSGQTFTSTKNMETEKMNSKNHTYIINSNTITPPYTSLRTDDSIQKSSPFTPEQSLENNLTETLSNRKTTLPADIVSSTMLKTEISTPSTSMKTTHYVTIPTTTSLKTTISSYTPQTSTLTLQTTISTAKQTLTPPQITKATSETPNTAISSLSRTLKTTTQSVAIPLYVDKSITTVSNVSSTLGKMTTRSHSSDTSTRTRTSTATSRTIVRKLPQATKFSNRFTKPTKSTLPKSEMKGKQTVSKSTVKGIVCIVIIAFICIIAGLAYCIRKRRSKRQSKLSDDSEIRFLSKSDCNEYSNPSSLNGILIQ